MIMKHFYTAPFPKMDLKLRLRACTKTKAKKGQKLQMGKHSTELLQAKTVLSLEEK